MAAREYEITESKVMKDSNIPQEREILIVAYGRTGDIKPTEENYKIAMGSYIVNQDTLDVEFWDPDSGWKAPTEGSDS